MRIHYLQNPRWLSEESLLNESKAAVPGKLAKLTDNFVCSEPERYHTKKLWFYQCPKYTIFVWAEVSITPWYTKKSYGPNHRTANKELLNQISNMDFQVPSPKI